MFFNIVSKVYKSLAVTLGIIVMGSNIYHGVKFTKNEIYTYQNDLYKQMITLMFAPLAFTTLSIIKGCSYAIFFPFGALSIYKRYQLYKETGDYGYIKVPFELDAMSLESYKRKPIPGFKFVSY